MCVFEIHYSFWLYYNQVNENSIIVYASEFQIIIIHSISWYKRNVFRILKLNTAFNLRNER